MLKRHAAAHLKAGLSEAGLSDARIPNLPSQVCENLSFCVIFIFVWHAHLFLSAGFTVPAELVGPACLVLGSTWAMLIS